MDWQLVKLGEKIEFDLKKADKTVNIAKSDKLISKMICYGVGQSTPVHSHKTQDEVFYVIEGRGTMNLNDEEVLLEPMDALFVPAGSRHGIKANKNSTLVITFVKSPGMIKH